MTTNLYRDTPPFTVAVDLDRGDDPQPSARCFATELPADLAVDLIADWATWQYAQSLSVRTVTERASAVKRCAQQTGTAPEFLQPQQIAEWLANDEWSARTRVTYYLALSAWFRWLATMGHRPVNPMERVGKPRQPRTVPRPITDANLRRLLGVLMRRRTRAMILLAALQGLRAHEIAKVKAEDFDLVDRTLTVKGKGGVVATLPLHHLVVEHAYLMPRTGYWFPGPDQGHQRRESVCQTIKQAMVRAGVRGSAHQLRHWFGTALVRAGVDLRTTQELMRHQNLASTAIYTAISDRQRAAGLQRLDPLQVGTLSDRDDVV